MNIWKARNNDTRAPRGAEARSCLDDQPVLALLYSPRKSICLFVRGSFVTYGFTQESPTIETFLFWELGTDRRKTIERWWMRYTETAAAAPSWCERLLGLGLSFIAACCPYLAIRAVSFLVPPSPQSFAEATLLLVAKNRAPTSTLRGSSAATVERKKHSTHQVIGSAPSTTTATTYYKYTPPHLMYEQARRAVGMPEGVDQSSCRHARQ